MSVQILLPGDELAKSRINFIRYMIYMAITCTFLLSLFALFESDYIDAFINIGLLIIPFLILIQISREKSYDKISNSFLVYVFLVMFVTVLTLELEPFDLLWLLIFPLPIFMIKGAKWGLNISLSYTLFLGIYFGFKNLDFPMKVYLNFFLILGIVIFLSYNHMMWRKKVYRELAKAYEKTEKQKALLREISIVDELTQIHNRRYFNEVLPRELNRCSRTKEILGFFILDIDYFKPYNDNYGHQAGDTALQKVSSVLKDEFQRREDYLFRLGGEEFGGIVFGADIKSIKSKVGSVCDVIRSLALKHEFALDLGILTVSVGLTLKGSKNDDWSEDVAYKEADLALYEAKESGRNCLVVYNS
jgi:diguanylate cyclase (GGDEF)-like protein